MSIKSHKDLLVWQKGIKLCKNIYKVTDKFPTSEMYGLSSQMRRSAVSISSNIAEGGSRNTTKDFLHFLSISLGSVSELETQIEISNELSFIDEVQYRDLNTQLTEISKMLVGLIKKLNDKTSH